MIDTNAVMVEHLKTSGTTLYTLVSTRIYTPRIPAGFTNSAAALEVFRRGGTSTKEHPSHDCSFQIKCFGGTVNMSDAETVYRALYDRLQKTIGVNTTSGNIISAFEEQIGQPLYDPTAGWPYVLTYWSVKERPKT